MFTAIKRYMIKKMVPTLKHEIEVELEDVTIKGNSFLRVTIEVFGFKLLSRNIPDFDVVDTL